MFRVLPAAAVVLAAISSANAGLVVVGGSFNTNASENHVGGNSATSDVLPLPLQTTDTVIAPSGNASAASTYDSTVTGDSASFQFDFSQNLHSDLTPNILITQSTNTAPLKFTVEGTNPLQYSLDSFFNLTGEAEIVWMDVALYDFTNLITNPFVGTIPRPVFQSHQESVNVTDESFLLGGLEGNNGNSLYGNPTGLLMPGVTYGLSYNFFIQDDNSSPVSGIGALNLNISPIDDPPVPEPSSIILLGIGCCALSTFGRKRKRQLAAGIA